MGIINMELPKIKKKVNAFLTGEDGKISKSTVITTTAAIAMIALSASALSTNAENHFQDPDGDGKYDLTTTEYVHSSHGSHGSCSTLAW